MTSLLLKFLLAHVLGDFVFQPRKWVNHKFEHAYKSPYLYFHVFIHAVILMLLLGFSKWFAVIVIAFSHYLIDLGKILLSKKVNARILFILDQLAHLAVILAVIAVYFPFNFSLNFLFANSTLLFLLFLVLQTLVSSVLIQLLMSKWEAEQSSESLSQAGFYIGILERLFIFGFIVLNQWSAIGFLIAAKSVFRFGDLSKAKDRKLTEYVLIGTLLSIGLAIFLGLTYKYLSVRI
ncbi:MAG: DUF3307 domain-containing protein [Cryomorphaceae bacterium]